MYKSGFATTQQAYENNVVPLFKALDRLEKILADKAAKSKGGPVYLVGDKLTEAVSWQAIMRASPDLY